MDGNTWDLLIGFARQYRRAGKTAAADALAVTVPKAAAGDRDAMELCKLELRRQEVAILARRERQRRAATLRRRYWERERKRKADAAHAKFLWHCQQHVRELNAASRREVQGPWQEAGADAAHEWK